MHGSGCSTCSRNHVELTQFLKSETFVKIRLGRCIPPSPLRGEDRGSEARKGGGGIGSIGVSPGSPRDRSGVGSGMDTELLEAGGGGGGTLRVAVPCCASTWTRRYGVPG